MAARVACTIMFRFFKEKYLLAIITIPYICNYFFASHTYLIQGTEMEFTCHGLTLHVAQRSAVQNGIQKISAYPVRYLRLITIMGIGSRV